MAECSKCGEDVEVVGLFEGMEFFDDEDDPEPAVESYRYEVFPDAEPICADCKEAQVVMDEDVIVVALKPGSFIRAKIAEGFVVATSYLRKLIP